MNATHQLMTMAEVAEFTRIPVNTPRFYRHKGTGPKSALIGGRVMYRRTDVATWVNAAFENVTTAEQIGMPPLGR